MNKGSRIFALAVVAAAALLILIGHRSEVARLGSPGVVIFSAITMMAFSILMLEHYFTRPTDVVATTTSVLLLLAPVHSDMSALGVWYWAFVVYAGFMLLLSLSALMLLDPRKPPESVANKTSQWLKNFVTLFANAKLMWFLVFSASLFSFVNKESSLFIWLAIVSAVLLVLDPKKIAITLFDSPKGEKSLSVARVIGVQSGSTVLAKIEPYAEMPDRFEFVQVNTSVDAGIGTVALVLDAYTLDEERWIRILSGPLIERMAGPVVRSRAPPASVCVLIAPQVDPSFTRFVGVVREGSNIDRVKFDYAGSAGISEGTLLHVEMDRKLVFYQVLDGVTVVETLESKNEAGLIVGEAVQLGAWNPERQVFEKFGWVPSMNSPLFLASDVQEFSVPYGEVKIGVLPATGYPISLDIEAAISHHIAILGVTGSGKSVFAREFVRKVLETGRKVICVDFTGEYETKLTGEPIGSIVEQNVADKIIQNLEIIAGQMDEFPNKRDKGAIAGAESEIDSKFREAFDIFLKGDKSVTLFALPDVTNSTVLLDYTKWFFKILFKVAKESQCFDKKVCVVLEEAHTVIPEWNFLGIDEKRASSLVNTIGQIALQGRKYGIGFVVVAQRTANVSKTVLTQCNTIIAFQQFDRTSAEFLSNYMGDMTKALPRLKPRMAIVVGKAFRGGTPLIFEVPLIEEPEQNGGQSALSN